MQAKKGGTMYGVRCEWPKPMDLPAEKLSPHRLLGAVQRPQHDPFPDESLPLHPHEPVLAADMVLHVRVRSVPDAATAPAAADETNFGDE